MDQQADQFLTTFNRIEKWLQKQLSNPSGMGFSEMVRRLAHNRNTQVAAYEDDLLQMAQLRNAIVHERIAPDFIIAEPNLWAVARLATIEKELTEPEKVLPRFAKHVTGFEQDIALLALLASVSEKGYSQFPLYEHGSFRGLITVHGLGLWLAQQSKTKQIDLTHKKAFEVLKADRRSGNYRFIAADCPIFQAAACFQQDPELEVLLITQTGDPNGNLLGIIRPRDLFTTPSATTNQKIADRGERKK